MIYLQQDMMGIFNSMWPLILMFVVIYFFMIRPQNKKQKEQLAFVTELDKGDEVVTNSGIVGKISKVEDTYITLITDGKTSLRVLKSAVSKEFSDSIS